MSTAVLPNTDWSIVFGCYGNCREQEENQVALDVTVEMVMRGLPDPLDPPGPPDREWVWLRIIEFIVTLSFPIG